MSITTDEIIEGIKTIAAAAIPIAVALGVSAGDVTALSDNAQALVVAGSATIVAARQLARDIRNR